MKKGVLIVALILFSLSFVIAAHVIGPASFSVDEDVSNRYNISVNNQDINNSANISQVSVTLPASFTFSSGSNGTDAGIHTFSSSSNVLTWVNDGLVMNLTTNYFWFDATADTPGSYNITVATTNSSGVETTNISVEVSDTGNPTVSLVSPANNSYDSDGIVTFECGGSDSIGLSALKLYIWNSTEEYSNLTGVSGTTNSTSWVHNLSADGVYTWNCLANDSTNNEDWDVNRTITIDGGSPSVTFSCSPTSVSKGSTISCSCSGTDDIDSSVSVSYDINPSTSSTGSFTTTCTASDDAGNSVSSSISYTVSGGGSGDFAVPPPEWKNTFVQDDTDLSEKGQIRKEFGEKHRVRLKINGEEHYVGVLELTETSVKIRVESEPQETTLNVGEGKKFDVNDDNIYDLLVVLNSISDSKADITVVSITDGVAEGIVEGVDFEDKTDESLFDEGRFPWLTIVLIIILVAVILLKKKKIMKLLKH